MLKKALAFELDSLAKVNDFLRNATKDVGIEKQSIIQGKKSAVKVGRLGGKSFISHLDNGISYEFKLKDLIKHVAKLSIVNEATYQDIKTNLAEVYIKIHAIDLAADKKLKDTKGFKKFAIQVRKIFSKIFHIPHARERIPFNVDEINDHVANILKSLETKPRLEMEEEGLS